jgi:hypothetical protein
LSDKDTIYFMARIRLKYGTLNRWYAIMPKMQSQFEAHGWKLQLALANVVGTVTEIVHVWEVPDANNVWGTLQAVRSSEALAEVAPELLDILLNEETQLKVKTPYSP